MNNNNKIITRKEALEKGLIHYFTGKPCVNGHISKRLTNCYVCVECAAIAQRAYREKQKTRLDNYYKQYYSNPKNQAMKEVKIRKNHHKEACPAWADLDAMCEIYEKKIIMNNNLAEGEEEYEVDHIIPFHGKVKKYIGNKSFYEKVACGLHVPYNLQIVKKSVNVKKKCDL